MMSTVVAFAPAGAMTSSSGPLPLKSADARQYPFDAPSVGPENGGPSGTAFTGELYGLLCVNWNVSIAITGEAPFELAVEETARSDEPSPLKSPRAIESGPTPAPSGSVIVTSGSASYPVWVLPGWPPPL